MYITKLILKNFRNYGSLDIDFSSGINFLQGKNGVGKTNIIESISILSNLKSFRNISDSEIVKWGEESYYCCSIVKEGNYEKYEVGFYNISDNLKKRAKIDDVEVKNASGYFGNLLTVIFSPSDISIVEGSPEIRRKFFDSLISKINIDYFKDLVSFRKILSSRNRVLKDIKENRSGSSNQLNIWDGMFAEKASKISEKRREFIDDFKSTFSDSYNKISGSNECPLLEYCSTTSSNDFDFILKELNRLKERDIYKGSTSIGPQRDDYVFLNDKKNIFNNFASQGQKRTAVISLKIAEIDFIERLTEKKAVILIDDIFSELDLTRRENMIEIFEKGNQVIFSIVNTGLINHERFNNIRKFSIKPGGRVLEL